MNVEIECKDDSELQLMARDIPQMNPIKAEIPIDAGFRDGSMKNKDECRNGKER
jgi:hypothetical protein